MDTLPFNLLDHILFRLDPKSLAMMQCTGRSINSRISDDPYFKSEYLSRGGSGLLHISSFGSATLSCYPFGDSRLFRNKDSLEVTTQILSSCSGLLLLFMDGLCVANPLTKRYRFLDHSNSKFLSRVDRRGNLRFQLGWDKMNRIGFAVDQIDRATQRFKVVCMNDTDASNPDEMMYQFEISTGDSCWRLSETTFTCSASILVADKKPVYLDGFLHWLRKDGSILAFNPETEQARLIPIKFPPKLSPTNLFSTAENELALISATEELVYVYALENILIDPKWVLVKRIRNGVLDKKRMRYWNVAAYDGKCLVVREMKKGRGHYKGVVHGYDLRANKWGVVGSIPEWCDGTQVFYQFKLSLSSAIELNEKVDVEMMTMVRGDDDKRISSLRKIMRLIDESSPYALTWLKKKEKRLGKGLMIEEETKLKMMMEEPSSKFIDVKPINKKKRFIGVRKINKRRRVK